MDVEIRFLGAAKSVTGSKYLLRVDGEAYMVDCGLFQGPSNMRRRNWEDVVEHPDEIREVLKSQPQAVRENVEEVSVDMWGGFQKVIQEVFPKALIVIDRFHVIKLVNKALNKIRLLLDLKGLKKRNLLLKNGKDLTEEETQELKKLLAQSPCLSIAYELKEELRDIYETSTSVKMGYRRLKKWLVTARFIFAQTA